MEQATAQATPSVGLTGRTNRLCQRSKLALRESLERCRIWFGRDVDMPSEREASDSDFERHDRHLAPDGGILLRAHPSADLFRLLAAG